MPASRASANARTTLAELPEPEIAMTTSPGSSRPRSGSTKISSYATSLAIALIEGTLSVSATARKRGRPATNVQRIRSLTMCDAVAALPPLPTRYAVPRRSQQA